MTRNTALKSAVGPFAWLFARVTVPLVAVALIAVGGCDVDIDTAPGPLVEDADEMLLADAEAPVRGFALIEEAGTYHVTLLGTAETNDRRDALAEDPSELVPPPELTDEDLRSLLAALDGPTADLVAFAIGDGYDVPRPRSSCGTWTGYWTWDGQEWSWTWVWIPRDCGWVVT